MSCPLEECQGDNSDREWVKANIPALAVTHRGPETMRYQFWENWMKAKAEGAVMAADCGWPVEARFVIACIDDDPENRKWNGPYPFMEIASFLAAAGMDPMTKYDRTESEMPVHDPLGDARQSARLLSMALEKLSKTP